MDLASLTNDALELHAQGKLTEAEPLCRRALEGYEQQLGAHHPDTLVYVHNLAQLLQAQGKRTEAEPLFRRSASSREFAAARCFGCGTQANLKRCAKCHVARFCSAECIARAWPAHKPNCKLWAQEPADGAAGVAVAAAALGRSDVVERAPGGGASVETGAASHGGRRWVLSALVLGIALAMLGFSRASAAADEAGPR